MNKLRIASFCRRRVGPFYRGSCFVVVTDVTKEFSSEILEAGKDASINDMPLLNFGEPDFDLVNQEEYKHSVLVLSMGA
jgi:hypothetical protein